MSLQEKKRNFLLLVTGLTLLLALLSVMPESICLAIVRKKKYFSFCHLIAYFVVAFFGCLFLRFQRRIGFLKMSIWNLSWIVFSLTAMLGGSLEGVQIFTPDRRPDLADFWWNQTGATLGIATFFCVLKLTSRFFSLPLTAKNISMPQNSSI